MKILSIVLALSILTPVPAYACFGHHKEKKIAKLERKLMKKEAKLGSPR